MHKGNSRFTNSQRGALPERGDDYPFLVSEGYMAKNLPEFFGSFSDCKTDSGVVK